MAGLLARCRIGYQILILGLMGVVGMASIAAINWSSRARIDEIDASAAEIRTAGTLENHLRIALLEARRYEKDYLLRPDDSLPQKHAQAISDAERAINALTEPLAGHTAERDMVRQIRQGMLNYVQAFDAVQNDIQVVGMDESQGLLGQLRTSVHDVEERLDTIDAPRATIAMLMMRRHEKDFIVRLDPKYGEQLAQRLPEFAAALDAADIPPDARTDLMKRMSAYQDTFDRFMRGVLLQKSDAATLNSIYDGMEQRLEALDTDFAALAEAGEQAAIDQAAHSRLLEMAALGIVALLVSGLSWLIGRGIARPITGVTRSMEALVKGDLDAPIPHDKRRDEVGTMIRAVQAFKDSLIAQARLHDEQAAADARAEVEKRAALAGMAERIESEAGAAVTQIGGRTAAMIAIVDQMQSLSERTGTAARNASSAAATALGNAQGVAGAAEELTASIREIGVQVCQSTAIAERAVAAGGEARATIEALNERVARIGTMASLIADIASRTNLLALNATIEAARAGQAGKGFAVVANEVKQLATQTARSTDEITRHIGEVRAATSDAVAAVARIETTISEVSTIAGSIAAAVEQQGTATAEIAHNVTETAAAVHEMTARNGEVSQDAEQAGQYAEQVADTTKALDSAVGALRQAVIRTVRSSTAAVDSSIYAQHDSDQPSQDPASLIAAPIAGDDSSVTELADAA